MSQANVEMARRANDAFNRRDVDAFMECVTSDIEFTAAMSGTVAGGSLRGREGVEALFADIRDTWEEHRMVIEEIRDLGERVLGLGRLEGRGKASGVSVDVPFALISDLRDGKMWRSRAYLDHGEALRAAGLPEQAMSQNVEIVRAGTTLLNEGNFDALFDLYHDDVEFCDLRSAVDTPQVLRGVEAVEALLLSWSEAWDDFGSEVYEYLDAEPYVICDTRWYGTGRESSVPIDIRQADVFELRDGKIIRVTLGYDTKAGALKAVGLDE